MIDNWTERQEGNVKFIHHSTSSVIEMKVKDESGIWREVWLDYYDFENLVKLISSLK